MNIPSQYNQIMPYLIVQDASAFIDFMKSVFEAKTQLIVPRNALAQICRAVDVRLRICANSIIKTQPTIFYI